ncbi:peptidoglycan D,D-transpeptidase FtsI family protein [Heyndrickxia oleronia]|uniref:serine-type D-Ala-D-Ala carboxypeptidase n=1 Tax=Heyndrickxia oleronia TaxID=38875 RepID=A0AAW6STF9_9BACI|nr:penicillin-binding protein 2 [Heyndrickxia oleronia]MDH5160137.1 penicillin-binding protein 2 [Heyndrickxia oleronia]
MSKKKRVYIPIRMNILFFIVFLLFSLLIFRLGIVQIVYGDTYKNEIKKTQDVIISIPVPRGQIIDRNGYLIVGNQPLNAITYTRPQSIETEQILEIAKKLAGMINKKSEEDIKAITERDRKDFWILNHPKEAQAKVSPLDEAMLKKKKLDKNEYDKEIYQLILKRITEKEIQSFTEKELEVLAIYREMMSGYPLSPQIIKNKNVTKEEMAIIAENLDVLPGVNTMTDWDRYNTYKQENGYAPLASVLGKITTSKEGLPRELANYYEAIGYSRNDRVGKSYLEYQYEEILRGQKEKINNVTNKQGNVIESNVIRKGKRGNDLVLSVDMELQQKVEEIISREIMKHKTASQPYLDRAFVTVMNPNTGEILALGGKLLEADKSGNNQMVDFALGNMITSYSMGSTVKAATVLTGYQTGAIAPNTYLEDRPLYFKDTKKKSSWNTSGFGQINDLYALKRSSNVYMFLTAMKIGGQQTYIPNGPLYIDKVEALKKFRHNFAQFGLGVKTGIDLPGEQIGYGGAIPDEPGKVLDFAIGQYDTYTPLQLVQYISTIANGGYRIQPHLAKEIREPGEHMSELGPIIQEISPKILNKLDMKTEWIERVQQGLISVVNEPLGTGYGMIKNKQFKIAGKTGTAQAQYDGPKAGHPMLWNLTFAGYAPYDNPEVAISVVVPWSVTDKNFSPNLVIADEVFKAYFDLKKNRGEMENSTTIQTIKKQTDTTKNEETIEE